MCDSSLGMYSAKSVSLKNQSVYANEAFFKKGCNPHLENHVISIVGAIDTSAHIQFHFD